MHSNSNSDATSFEQKMDLHAANNFPMLQSEQRFLNCGLGPSRGPVMGNPEGNITPCMHVQLNHKYNRDDLTDVGFHSLHCQPPRLQRTLKTKFTVNNKFQVNALPQKTTELNEFSAYREHLSGKSSCLRCFN